MRMAEHREPYDLRESRTVLGARGGEIPPRDSPNGRSDRRETDVPVARRRPRGRSPRHARSASARYEGGTPADAQAAQETGLPTEVADHRQAGLLRFAFPATTPHLSSRSRPQKEYSRGKLASNRAATR